MYRIFGALSLLLSSCASFAPNTENKSLISLLLESHQAGFAYYYEQSDVSGATAAARWMKSYEEIDGKLVVTQFNELSEKVLVDTYDLVDGIPSENLTSVVYSSGLATASRSVKFDRESGKWSSVYSSSQYAYYRTEGSIRSITKDYYLTVRHYYWKKIDETPGEFEVVNKYYRNCVAGGISDEELNNANEVTFQTKLLRVEKIVENEKK